MGLVRLICLASAARVMSLADDCLFKLPRFCNVLCSSSSSPTVFNLSLLILSNFLRRFRSHTVNVPPTRLSSLFPLHSFPFLPKELSLRSSRAGINRQPDTPLCKSNHHPPPHPLNPPHPPKKPNNKQTTTKNNQFCQRLSVSTQRPTGWGYKMPELKTSSCVDLDTDGSVRNTSRAQ